MRFRLRAATFVVLAATACAPSEQRQMERLLEGLHSSGRFADAVASTVDDMPTYSYDDALREWEKVRKGYADVLTKYPESAEAKARLLIATKQIEILRVERDYKGRVEIPDVSRGSGNRTNFGLPAEGVFGEVKNAGDKTIDLLHIRCELIDASGRAVADDVEIAIAHANAGVDKLAALKPNHTRPFGQAVDSAPSDWVAVRASVKRLNLSREGADLGLIRSRGHLPKGGYDVRHGISSPPTTAAIL